MRMLRVGGLTVLSVLWLVPTYLLVVNAFVPVDQYTGSPTWWPTGFGLVDNLRIAWEASDLGLSLASSLLYAGSSGAIAVVAAATASFAVVVIPVARPQLWFWLIYSGTLFPLQIFLIPLFRGYVSLGLYDTQLGLVLVYSALCIPFAFFIVRNYLVTVGREVTEAAQLDGASWARIFVRIHLPLVRSSLLAAFVFQFTWVWNDLLFGITLTTSPNIRPVMAAIAELDGGFSTLGPPVVLAAALAVSLPTVVLFLAFQRFFVANLRPAT